MLKRSKKIIAVLVVLIYLFSMISTVFAQPSDIAGNPSAGIINHWLSLGLAQAQSDGTFKPNEVLRRIDFFTYINKVFNFTEKSSATFADVVPGTWYGDEIAKAVAAGYLQGDKNKKVSPFVSIKKIDAVVILAKLFDLHAASSTTLQQFDDEDKIPASYRDAVSALVERGYVDSRTDGNFGPFDTLTRVQAIKLINNVMGDVVNKAGLYKANALDNLVINTRDAVLYNCTVNGNLYLTEGIGDGNVTVENVTIKGRVIVRGGGENSIVFRNSTIGDSLEVNKKDGKVRVVADGTTSIPLSQLSSGAKLEETNVPTTSKGFEQVQVNGMAAPNQSVKLKGNFTDVTVTAAGASLQTEGNVNNINLNDSSNNSVVNVVSGTVTQVSVKSDKSTVDVKGGYVTTLNVTDSSSAAKVVVEGNSVVGTLDTRANSNVSVKSGLITNLLINSGASGSSVQIDSTAGVTNLTAGASVDVKGSGSIGGAFISANGVRIEQKPGSTVVGNGIIANVGGSVSSTTSTSTTTAGTLAISQSAAIAGSSQTVYLTYTLGDSMSNGSVAFKLPAGLIATNSDSINIANLGATTLAPYIQDSGRTVSIPSLNASSGQTIVITLFNKTVPNAGVYYMNVIADADGTGPRLPTSGSGNEVKAFTSNGRGMTWSTSTFSESNFNDGKIANTITVTLTNETFASALTSTDNQDPTKTSPYFTAENVPSGLYVKIDKVNDTTATISLMGVATKNTNLDSITNLKISFLGAAFTSGSTQYIANASNSALAIDFNGAAPATVADVKATTADGSYNAGKTIAVEVTFSGPVDVTGTPVLHLETGDTDHDAVYASGTGTNKLIFNYTVAAGDTSSDLDYVSTTALAFGSGESIKNAGSTVDANPALPAPGAAHSLGANNAIVIDTTIPTKILISSQNTIAANGGTVTLTAVGGPLSATSWGDILAELQAQDPVTHNARTGTNGDWIKGINSTDLTLTPAADGVTAVLKNNNASVAANIVADFDIPAEKVVDLAGNAAGVAPNKITIDAYANAVTIVSVSSTASGSYKAGQTIPITVKFSGSVDVDNAQGVPTLKLETGNTDALALYNSGSGSDTLTFNYAIKVGENASNLDYVDTSSLSLAGGAIRNTGSNVNADLTLPAPGTPAKSLSKNAAIVIDTIAPTGINITTTTQNTIAANGGTVTLTAVGGPLSDDSWNAVLGVIKTKAAKGLWMTGFDSAKLSIQPAADGVTAVLKNGDTSAATIVSDFVIPNSNVVDRAGNVAPADVTIDAYIPIVPVTVLSVKTSATDKYYKAGDTIDIEVTFSGPVDVDSTGKPTLTLETGLVDEAAKYVSGAGTSKLLFRYTVVAGDNSPDLDIRSTTALVLNGGYIRNTGTSVYANLTLPGAGSTNAISSTSDIIIDTTAPTAISISTPNIIPAQGSVTLTAVYGPLSDTSWRDIRDEIKANIGAGKNWIIGITAGNLDIVPNGDTATLTNSSTSDAKIVSIFTISHGNVVDMAGNSPSANIIINAYVPPAATIVQGVSSQTPNGSYKAGDIIYLNVKFKDKVDVTGVPLLHLETGTPDTDAQYDSGSGTDTLVFKYVVGATDNTPDLDYKGFGSLDLNGGTIKNSGTNVDANVNLPAPGSAGSLSANNAIVIDTKPPSAILISNQNIIPAGGSVTLTAIDGPLSEDSWKKILIDNILKHPDTASQPWFKGVANTDISIVPSTDGVTAQLVNKDNAHDLIITAAFDITGTDVVDLAGNSRGFQSIVINSYSAVYTVVNVNSTLPSGSYKVDPLVPIPVTVTFSGKVVVAGNPYLLMQVGPSFRQAVYKGGSGTDTLTFEYTVQQGDASPHLDYASSGSLQLNGGSIKMLNFALDADTTLPNPGSVGSLEKNKTLVIDTVAPTGIDFLGPQNVIPAKSSVTLSAVNGPLTKAAWDAVLYAIKSSMTTSNPWITGVIGSDLSLNYSTDGSTVALVNSAAGDAIIKSDFTVPASSIVDLAGNVAVGDGNKNITIDSYLFIPPVTVAKVSSTNGYYGTSVTVNITVTFSGPVDVDVSNGNPELQLKTSSDGKSDHSAFYNDGSVTNTDSLTFEYMVVSGDNSDRLDYKSNAALVLNGATIRNAGKAVPADLKLSDPGQKNSLTDNNIVIIDTTAPTGINISAQNSIPGGGSVTLTCVDGPLTDKSWQDIQDEIRANTLAGHNWITGIDVATNIVITPAANGATATLTNKSTSTAILAADFDISDDKVVDRALNVASHPLPHTTVINAHVDPATVSAVSSTTANGTYNIGKTVSVTVQFSTNVDVDTSGGTPTLSMDTGATKELAVYTSGSGTDTLTFTYKVVDGDVSPKLNYVDTASLTMNGGTIRNMGTTVNVTPTLPSVAGNGLSSKSIIIDALGPTAITISDQNVIPAGGSVTLTVVNGPLDSDSWLKVVLAQIQANTAANKKWITGILSTDLALTQSGTGDTATLKNTSTSDAVIAADFPFAKGTLTDKSGNKNKSDISVDSYLAPGPIPVTGVNATNADGAYKTGQTIAVTVTFAGAVDVTGTPKLHLNTGTTKRDATYASGSGTKTLTFNYVIVAGDAASDLDYVDASSLVLSGGTIKNKGFTVDANLTLPAPGAIGSLSDARNIVIDTTTPTYSTVALNATHKVVTITFSEPVINNTADLAALKAAIQIAPNGSTFVALGSSDTISLAGKDLVVTFNQALTTATNKIKIAASALKDAAGNIVTTAVTTGAIDASQDILPPSVATATMESTAPDKIVLTFDEVLASTASPKIGDFAVDIDGSAATLSTINVNASAKTITLTLASAAVNGQTVSVTYTPSAGNEIKDPTGNMTGTFTQAVTNNIEKPAAITSVSATNGDGTYGQGQKIYITVTFDKAVTVTGTPTLLLETGFTDEKATYYLGSSTNTLIFVYTVQDKDSTADLNYNDPNSLALNGGTIVDNGTAINAVLLLPTAAPNTSLAQNKNIVIDTAPPTLKTTTVASITDTQAVLTVQSTKDGKAYFIVVSKDAPIPLATQVKLGVDSWDYSLPVNMKGVISLEGNKDATVKISGLIPSTDYAIYVVAEDGAGNIQSAATKTSPFTTTTTPDTTPPVLTATPILADKTNTSYSFTLNSTEAGKVYYVVLTRGADMPSALQVKSGLDESGTALAANRKGSVTVAEKQGYNLTISGLTPLNLYDVYFVAEDNAMPPNLALSTPAVQIDTNTPVDTTAPTFVSVPAVVDQSATTANVGLKTNESGKAYYVVLASNAAAPTAAQVKAGTNAAGAAPVAKGSISLAANTDAVIGITGLTKGTAYNIFVVAEDALANLQATAAKVPVTTTSAADVLPPNNVVPYPMVVAGDNYINLRIKTDEDGKAYYVVLNKGAAAPTPAQVKSGKDGANSTAVKSGNTVLTANVESLVTVTGLMVSTQYDIYIVSEDSLATPNLQQVPVKLQMATNPVDLSKLGVDVAAKQITGTTSAMEYSLDSVYGTAGTWTACGQTNTSNVAFTAGDVYVREKANPTNVRWVARVTTYPAPTTAFMASISLNVAAGTITGTDNNMEYMLAGGNWTPVTAGGKTSSITFIPGQVMVRYKATTSQLASAFLPIGYNPPSNTAGTLVIGAPPAPSVDYDDYANTITGMDNTFEYKIGAGVWTSGDVTGDFTGTKIVQVRLKATATRLAGAIQTINFTTNMDFSGVGINISASQIYGTTTNMEYSTDSTNGQNGHWTTCAASVTTINLANAANVYVRDKNQKINYKLLADAQNPPTIAMYSVNLSGGQSAVVLNITPNTMEYSRNGGTTWITATLSSYTLDLSTAPYNDLRVRMKATSTKLASDPTSCLNALVNLSGVTLDVANNTIKNTDITMEYSLNSNSGLDGNWSLCSSPATVGLNFIAGNVYVRVAAQPTNFKALSIPDQDVAPSAYLAPTASTASTTRISGLSTTKTYQYIVDGNATIAGNAIAWSSAKMVNGVTLIDNVAVTTGQYIHIRVKGTTTLLPSAIQDVNVRIADIKPAAAPTVGMDNLNTATAKFVTSVTGLEYSIDGSSWADLQDSTSSTPTVLNLIGTHTIYVRIKATSTLPASDLTIINDTTNP